MSSTLLFPLPIKEVDHPLTDQLRVTGFTILGGAGEYTASGWSTTDSAVEVVLCRVEKARPVAAAKPETERETAAAPATSETKLEDPTSVEGPKESGDKTANYANSTQDGQQSGAEQEAAKTDGASSPLLLSASGASAAPADPPAELDGPRFLYVQAAYLLSAEAHCGGIDDITRSSVKIISTKCSPQMLRFDCEEVESKALGAIEDLLRGTEESLMSRTNKYTKPEKGKRERASFPLFPRKKRGRYDYYYEDEDEDEDEDES